MGMSRRRRSVRARHRRWDSVPGMFDPSFAVVSPDPPGGGYGVAGTGAAVIMPAATVALVASSTRMKLPVMRFAR